MGLEEASVLTRPFLWLTFERCNRSSARSKSKCCHLHPWSSPRRMPVPKSRNTATRSRRFSQFRSKASSSSVRMSGVFSRLPHQRNGIAIHPLIADGMLVDNVHEVANLFLAGIGKFLAFGILLRRL